MTADQKHEEKEIRFGLCRRTSDRLPTRRFDQLPDVLLLVLLVVCVYFSRLADLPVRGEESRRGRVAVEMLESGNWIAPRLQGELYLSRPPLQNWAIALAGMCRGRVDDVAVRLPSALAILLTVLMIYGYSRAFLSRPGAFLAAAVYATTGQVLELGRLGETEALFTLFVSGSLLVWHWGHVRGWPRTRIWAAAYLLVALATLTKGLQAPVYFAACIGGYLIWTRRWRELLGRSHLLGLVVFAAVWGAWQIPFFLETGLENGWRIYGDNVAGRYEDMRLVTIIGHFAGFPFEVLFGCLLPWSVLLIWYLSPGLRNSIGSARPQVLFLACCLLVTFPSCWLTPAARPRYFMPLYPCIAPLIALVAERCWQSDQTLWWQKSWKHFLVGVAGVMAVTGIAVLVFSLVFESDSPLSQPRWFAALYCLASLVLAGVVVWSCRAVTERQRRASVLAVAVFMGLTYTGVVTNTMQRTSVDMRDQVGQLRDQIPDDVRLVSFGNVDHKFAFYFQNSIEKRSWPVPNAQPITQAAGTESAAGLTYFCFQLPNPRAEKPLGFDWEAVAVINCDRNRHGPPRKRVIVGRRIDANLVRDQPRRSPMQQAGYIAPPHRGYQPQPDDD